jgi:hypothetical protein
MRGRKRGEEKVERGKVFRKRRSNGEEKLES